MEILFMTFSMVSCIISSFAIAYALYTKHIVDIQAEKIANRLINEKLNEYHEITSKETQDLIQIYLEDKASHPADVRNISGFRGL